MGPRLLASRVDGRLPAGIHVGQPELREAAEVHEIVRHHPPNCLAWRAMSHDGSAVEVEQGNRVGSRLRHV